MLWRFCWRSRPRRLATGRCSAPIPQRTGWAARETLINRNNAGTLELKWKIKLDNAPKELTSLTAPIVVDQVKIPRGIKEYVVVGGSSDAIFAIDADTGKLAWSKSFTVVGAPTRNSGGALPVCAQCHAGRIVYRAPESCLRHFQ